MTDNAKEELIYHTRDNIGFITLNRPHRRNALTFDMYEGISKICARAGTADDPDRIKVLVFSGGGNQAFAAGTDIAQFNDFSTAEQITNYEAMMDAVLCQIEDCAVPTIAALNGYVTGGGAAIATACSVRIGSQDLRVGVPIAKTLGNCLAIANLRRLVALIGEARTRYILLTAELIDADEALRSGFVSEVLADKAGVDARAHALAKHMTTMAPLTLKASMEGLRRLRRATALPDDSDLVQMCFGSADFQEGMAAFFEKRQPNWQGK